MSHPGSSLTTAGGPASQEKSARTPQPAAILATVWVLGLAAAVASKFRGDWDTYKALHQWCAAKGIPDWARNFDSLILFAVAAFVGAGLVARWCGGSAVGRLGLQIGRGGWGPMVAASLLPMVGGGIVLAVLRWSPEATLAGLLPKFIGGVVRAPIGEELLFRGLLVGVAAAAVGWRGPRFWGNAAAAAMLFAVMHVTWSVQGIAGGWGTLLMTGAGGVWYAWLLARWGSLWVPMLLHAGMNLGWLLAGASGGAGGGGLVENLLRVGTIAIATWWTVRRTGDR